MAEPIPEKEIEGAYELPEGWVWTKTSEVAEVITGTTPPKKEKENYGNYIPFVKPPELNDSVIKNAKDMLSEIGSEKARILPPNSVLVSCIGILGKTGLNEVSIAFNQQINAAIFYRIVLPKYGFFYFQTPQAKDCLDNISSSTTIPIVNKSRFNSLPFPLPPLVEQRRITAKLEALLVQVNAAKHHLAAVPSIIKRFRQSVLAAACSGRLTEDWRREHPDVEPTSELLKKIQEERIRRYAEECKRAKEGGRRKPRKPSNITQNEFAIEGLIALPNGWTWAALDDLSANEANSITDGPFGSKLKTEHYTESGPRVIRLQNIGDGKFIDAKAHISSHHFENLRKHEIFGGDMVIAALGTDLPRACIIPNYVGHAIVKADCIRFKPHLSITNNQYMNASLNSDILKHIAQSIVHGVGRPRLNQQQVKSLPIPLPPLPEQRAIVNRIETLFHRTSEVEERIVAATSHADCLTQSILAKAFRGELVPQDPDDEPASVLLERIRKERTELKKKKKPQKRRSKTLSDSN